MKPYYSKILADRINVNIFAGLAGTSLNTGNITANLVMESPCLKSIMTQSSERLCPSYNTLCQRITLTITVPWPENFLTANGELVKLHIDRRAFDNNSSKHGPV